MENKKLTQNETAAFVKESRKTLKLTQEELAERIGSNRYNIAKYETGATTPPGPVILRIQKLLESDIQL